MTTFRQLLSPELQGIQKVDAGDRAQLITEVYTDMGIFDPAQAEAAPELLRPELDILAEKYPNTEPFIAVNLTDRFGLDALATRFNRRQSEGGKTFIWPLPWSQYDLDDLNRRSIGGRNEPAPTAVPVRGQDLTVENDYGEAGLIATNKSLAEQRTAAIRDVLLNVTDYILLQALRREEGQPLMDRGTTTRFVQMDEKPPDGPSHVGVAHGDEEAEARLHLGGASGLAYVADGFRRSFGSRERRVPF